MMSEQEKKSGGSAIGSSVIVMEQTASSRHKQPYRPTELQDDTDLHHKRSKAPVAPPVAEELKNAVDDTALYENAKIEEQKEYTHAIPSEKHKHSAAKKLASSTKARDHSPESIALAPLDFDKKKPSHQLSPPNVQSDLVAAEKEAAKKADDDSITDEITELQTSDPAKEHSEWSDDEEASGLPRSDSRASRVSRMVRQFFCCGVAYNAPSEDNISTHRGFAI